MTDYDIHSCGYYCNRPACIEVQRNELRDKLFEIRTSERNIQTSDKETPESSQPTEPTIDGWPLWSGLPQPEPVAYIDVETRNLSWAKPTRWETPTVVKMDRIPLYTTPPKKEWAMDDEDWRDMWEQFDEHSFDIREEFQKEMVAKYGKGYYYMDGDEDWKRQKALIQKLIEAKLKEKNT